MPNLQANGVTIEYETFGRNNDPALLLINGLSAQMIEWPGEFCRLLAGKGLYVIRFDNRDAGLSTRITEYGPDRIRAAWTTLAGGEQF